MGILSHLTITATGALAQDATQLKKWTEANGGKWVPRVQKGVTHLIASKDAWKKRVDAVQRAIDIGASVVSYDWLEDSLQRKRKLAEKKYTWEYLRKECRKRKELKRMGKILDAKKFTDGCEMAKQGTGSGMLRCRSKPKPSKSFFFGAQSTSSRPFALSVADVERRRKEGSNATSVEKLEQESSPSAVQDSKSNLPVSPPASVSQEAKPRSLKDLYHYYLDNTGFEYKITLFRSNFYANNLARYQLCILESHTKPHVYCTLVTYTPPAPAPCASHPAGQTMKHALLSYNKSAEPATPNPPTPNTAYQDPHSEATRLLSLTTPPLPSATSPYKSLICPLNSTFLAAFFAFRTAFRDLTLIGWEERFDQDKRLQKARAKELNTEPFVYSRPALGMPDGTRPQAEHLEDKSDHVRNRFQLPGLEVPLGGQGVVGRAVERDQEEAERMAMMMTTTTTAKKGLEETARWRVQAGNMDMKPVMDGSKRVKKPNFNRPLFHCVTGRPRTDTRGHDCAGQRGGGTGICLETGEFCQGQVLGI